MPNKFLFNSLHKQINWYSSITCMKNSDLENLSNIFRFGTAVEKGDGCLIWPA